VGESRELRLVCVADEAHRLAYAKSPIDSMLREARKYGVGMILASQSPHDFDPVVFGNVATKICFRCPYDEDAQFMAKQMGCQPSQILNLSRDFEAMVRLGSTEMCERVRVVPYFQRARQERQSSPPKTSEPVVQSEAESGEFGGQVKFGKEGGLTGDASLKKWTKKDRE